jgi:uncharacterized membrane protein YbaN (DUF454 family)
MQSVRSVALATSGLMKVVLEHRTYEQHGGEWIEVGAAPRSRRLLHDLADLAANALAIVAVAVIVIVAACVALLLLPIAFLAKTRRS